MNFVSHFLHYLTAPRYGTWNESPKHTWKPTTPQLRHQKLCTIQLRDCLSNNFRRLPKETAPRFRTWNESPKHTQKLTTPQSICRKRCTIQVPEIDLRQFSSGFLANYPSYLAHGMKAQNIHESQQHLNRDVKAGAKSNSMNFSPT
jgi:hypothetical protein